ncbi:MAG: peptide deformylase [Butyrivibrio sp.]|nr:peptide deformylase [Butyrivibrio sp.]
MALRTIREYGDDVLAKPCKEVKEVTPRIRELVDDMLDTMYEANGVGLAAPQVGVLKRIVVIDVSPEGDQPIVMINPTILEADGEQTGYEGCLSIPGKSGIVTRPNHVRAKAYDLDMNEYEIEGEELLARAICHELDHLDGHMYVEKVEGDLVNNEDLVASQEEEENE